MGCEKCLLSVGTVWPSLPKGARQPQKVPLNEWARRTAAIGSDLPPVALTPRSVAPRPAPTTPCRQVKRMYEAECQKVVDVKLVSGAQLTVLPQTKSIKEHIMNFVDGNMVDMVVMGSAELSKVKHASEPLASRSEKFVTVLPDDTWRTACHLLAATQFDIDCSYWLPAADYGYIRHRRETALLRMTYHSLLFSLIIAVHWEKEVGFRQQQR